MRERKPLFIGLSVLLLVMVCIAYSGHFHNPFHFDDEHTIVTNMYIRDIKNIPQFFTDATTFSSLPANQAWRPGVTTLDAIDCWFGGKDVPTPFAYHVHIFIDYLLLGVFIYLFVVKLFDIAFKNDLNPYIALLTTAVYLLHTGNAETINYIISRSDSESTLMILISLCMLAYLKPIKYRAEKYQLYLFVAGLTILTYMVAPEAYKMIITIVVFGLSLLLPLYFKPKFWRNPFYLIPMFIGFMIKEPSVMIGPLAFIFILFFEDSFSLNNWMVIFSPLMYVISVVFPKWFKTKNVADIRSGLKIYWWVSPAFIIAIALFLFSQHQTPSTWTSGGTDKWAYMKTETFVMVHYVVNFFFPFNLSADTDWGLINNIFDDRVIIGVAFILFTLYLAYVASLQQKSRPIAYGILWFYLALIPTSSVVPFSEVLNDHRVFFPYIGLCISLVWALFLLYKKYEVTVNSNSIFRPVILACIGLFLCAHVYGVRVRSEVWSSDDKLWKDVAEKSPHNGRGLMNYGLVFMAKGDYKNALEWYNKAKQEWPYYSYIYVNLGVLYSAQGNVEESEKDFKYALQLNPGNPNCYFYYAIMLKNAGRIEEAKANVRQGLALSPHHVDLINFMNDLNTNPAYVKDEKVRKEFEQKKIEGMEAAVKQNPTPEGYLNLSLQYYNAGRYLDCAQAAEEATKLKPDYDLAYSNICAAYNVLHEWDKAIVAGQKAVAANPNNLQAKANLQASLDGKKAGTK